MKIDYVALFTRAWIEIPSLAVLSCFYSVALFTRAWIEIANVLNKNYVYIVALFTRAWIEMVILQYFILKILRRPLHEGVD